MSIIYDDFVNAEKSYGNYKYYQTLKAQISPLFSLFRKTLTPKILVSKFSIHQSMYILELVKPDQRTPQMLADMLKLTDEMYIKRFPYDTVFLENLRADTLLLSKSKKPVLNQYDHILQHRRDTVAQAGYAGVGQNEMLINNSARNLLAAHCYFRNFMRGSGKFKAQEAAAVISHILNCPNFKDKAIIVDLFETSLR